MADDALSIANRALQHSGARSIITSFDENSNEAKNVKLLFDSTVREVLAEVRWNFTSAYADGVAVSGPLPPQWRYAYAVPTDMLAMRAVFAKQTQASGVPIFGAALSAVAPPVAGKVAYALATLAGARVLFCNLSTCVLWYTLAQADFTWWEPLAIRLLEYRLAAKLALPLSGDKALAQMAMQMADQTKQAAMVLDANDDTSVQDVPPDWLLVREGVECNPPSFIGTAVTPVPEALDIRVTVDGGRV